MIVLGVEDFRRNQGFLGWFHLSFLRTGLYPNLKEWIVSDSCRKADFPRSDLHPFDIPITILDWLSLSASQPRTSRRSSPNCFLWSKPLRLWTARSIRAPSPLVHQCPRFQHEGCYLLWPLRMYLGLPVRDNAFWNDLDDADMDKIDWTRRERVENDQREAWGGWIV